MNEIDKTQKMIAVWASDKIEFDKMLDDRSRAGAFHRMVESRKAERDWESITKLLQSLPAYERQKVLWEFLPEMLDLWEAMTAAERAAKIEKEKIG